ncbi:uncharacterized protein LOC129909379 [Episyrphus balteatus]|uniref:uncharacterized protein LOC129909379 n=1 Tax=Episyrphus balteatus TaxID=286459 RepID=UPI0024850FF4|nr:uncharacterized protein LOC129909379 [Episyrphus balteatus]
MDKNVKIYLTDNEILSVYDASKDTSAAVVYLRIQSEGKVCCTLLASKTKVAPIKLTSIPRLELIAALIGARLACTIRQSLSTPINKIFYWSDSVTVLRWLRSDAKATKGQFVAFRIAEIQELSNIGNWRYTPSYLNVADDATKWKKGPSLNMNDRWFKGPEFLHDDEVEWPDDISLQPNPEIEILEAVHHLCESAINFEKFSSWFKMLRLTAFVHRGIHVLLNRKTKIINSKFLTSHEYKRAEISLFKLIQIQSYENEIKCLKQYGNLIGSKKRFSNEIISLKPYLDEDGVLRSMSRIDKTDCVSMSTKRPIILSQHHHGTELLVTDYHERFRHINHETVVNEIRKKFYIPRLRQFLKRIRTSCNRCKILRAKPRIPEMAELPAVRMTPYTPPFTYTAVDYGGPFEVINGRKLEKRWICLFTCLVVRAVHIEIAYSCSTDSFILCYRNFLSRRGPVKKIFSDRGTNFVGAEKILRQDLKQIDSQTIASKFISAGLEWHFHPPGSPHMNGCVERLIKSVKIALYAVSDVTTYKPNDELFRSYLKEVEDMINSRPLTYLPLDSEESESLTPNHFLRQLTEGSSPIPFEDLNENVKLYKTNALMSQLYAKHYWKRWILEYLPTLTRREKWTKRAEPLQVGDIVLLIDERSSRKSWPKGRVLKVHMSKDDQVRSATVKTADGIYNRPAVKLAKLDIGEDVHLSEALDQCTEGENVKKTNLATHTL